MNTADLKKKKKELICLNQAEFIKDTAKSVLNIQHMQRISDKHCKIILFKNFKG